MIKFATILHIQDKICILMQHKQTRQNKSNMKKTLSIMAAIAISGILTANAGENTPDKKPAIIGKEN